MVMVLINWLYIAVTTFLTGYGILGLFAHLFEYRVRHTILYFWTGLAFVTVYAQFFSLFSGVSVGANLLLMAGCFGVVRVCRKSLSAFLTDSIREWKCHKWKCFVYIFLVLLMAYGTSRGYMHFDTGLYHAQSIRWIEEYGVVPGLANVQGRFGYNSAAFALTALYSMKGIFGQSLHTTAGFFALLGTVLALDLYKVFTEKRIRLADFVRLGLVFYLSVIFSEMMSPASDYYAQLLLFTILILWLEEDAYQADNKIQNPVPYGLICILIVYAVTIKFSVAVLLLLVLKPAVMLIKNKTVKQIVMFLASGLFVAIPFFIRNVLISGWLVYPFPGIDLFTVDWKIPKWQVEFDATEIGVYGKGLNDVSKQNYTFSQWVPSWFSNLKALEKIFVLLTAAAVFLGAMYLLYKLVIIVLSIKNKKDETGCQDKKRIWNEKWDFPLVFLVFTASMAFWFVSAPLIRYGYSYVTVLPLLTFGFFYLCLMQTKVKEKKVFEKAGYVVFCVALIVFLFTRVKGLADDIIRTWKEPYYFVQTDYEDGEATIEVVDGITFYVPQNAGQIGYNQFPASMFPFPIELRGDSIEDGFRQKATE